MNDTHLLLEVIHYFNCPKNISTIINNFRLTLHPGDSIETCSKSNHILSHIKCHIDYHDQSDLNLDSLVISHVKCFINKTLKCESVWNLIAK
jgi:hypothetical protein